MQRKGEALGTRLIVAEEDRAEACNSARKASGGSLHGRRVGKTEAWRLPVKTTGTNEPGIDQTNGVNAGWKKGLGN